MMNDERLPDRFQLIALETVGSTNDEAKRLARNEAAPEGTVVWALEQTAGRGRRERSWVSKPGNFYCSIILRPDSTAAVAGQLGFVVAIAVCDALEAAGIDAVRIRCKWPNDVLVDGQKIAGILLEGEASPNRSLEWLIAGCGMNLVHHPAGTEFPATSLTEATGISLAPAQMLPLYCRALERRYVEWDQAGFGPIRTAWLARAHAVSDPINVRLNDQSFSGEFETLDTEGALVVKCDGISRRVTAGDVYFGQVLSGAD